ncbi:Uncharacterized protein dnm_091540 [Desulfonema magnum]|uniref:Uncharacterized protein n=1 Tax=Desulfonema magnum TaxID=45655 RepID=A0A975GTG9_9BACT|nr:Uncharacterized protein dnm_091540 [Desulfonema magnum]
MFIVQQLVNSSPPFQDILPDKIPLLLPKILICGEQNVRVAYEDN